MLLDNGVLITYSLVKHSGDIERIFLDKSLVARLGAKVDNGEGRGQRESHTLIQYSLATLI